MKQVQTALVLSLLFLGGNAPPAINPLVALSFNRYYDVEEMGEALAALEAAYPNLLSLGTMGQSREGRELWVMTVNNPETGDASTKPAMYIDANTHGNEIQGGEVALFTINYLVTKFGQDPWVTDLLNRFSFYIAPTVNPDSRHRFFHEANNPHSPRQNQRPHDNDGDGSVDEDGPEDLNGDGEITMMRRIDPLGSMVLGEDPRTMRGRRPGEEGGWKTWWTEGIDNDGDGRINEDGPGGVDLNRQFPWEWSPDHRQHGAGPYMLSEPETRSTANFVRNHPNIAAVQSYHNAGDMILRPPGAESTSSMGMPRSDLRVMDGIAERSKAFLPDYEYLEVFGGLYPVHGGFFDWTYGALGIISFTNELYAFNPDYDDDGVSSQEERMRWNDEVAHGACFSDWEEFEHPDLGWIEIGGWRAFCTRAPLPDELPEMAMRNTLFTLLHASFMPQVALGKTTATRLERGLWQVEVEILNLGEMPTASGQARRVGIAKEERLTVLGGELVASGERELDSRGGGTFVTNPHETPIEGEAQVGNLGPMARRWIVLLVRASRGDALVIVLDSEKGGSATQEIQLPRR
ncbi:hypothetical protein H8D30_02315 [bacterium]|nr:hypothetical protein [bacterium]